MVKYLYDKIALLQSELKIRDEKIRKLQQEIYEVECLLSEALGYRYEKNYGYPIGEIGVIDLAQKCMNKIQELQNTVIPS